MNWAAINKALENYAKTRLSRSALGQAIGLNPPDPNAPIQQPVRIGSQQQIGDLDRTPAGMTPPEQIGQMDRTPAIQDAQGGATQNLDWTSAPPDETSNNGSEWGGVDAFAGGKLVTTPTIARIGERGPEAVIPLSSAPGQKISPGMLGSIVSKNPYRRFQTTPRFKKI